jgi:hypothetical protein
LFFFYGLYADTNFDFYWLLWHRITSLQLICPPFSEHSINKVVGFHLVSSFPKVTSRMSSLCSCSFIGTKDLWIALLTNQEKMPSFLGIISVENKLKHGTSIWHCASPGEPRKAEAERTSNQTNSVTHKCDKSLKKNRIHPYIWWRCSLITCRWFFFSTNCLTTGSSFPSYAMQGSSLVESPS